MKTINIDRADFEDAIKDGWCARFNRRWQSPNVWYVRADYQPSDEDEIVFDATTAIEDDVVTVNGESYKINWRE